MQKMQLARMKKEEKAMTNFCSLIELKYFLAQPFIVSPCIERTSTAQGFAFETDTRRALLN